MWNLHKIRNEELVPAINEFEEHENAIERDEKALEEHGELAFKTITEVLTDHMVPALQYVSTNKRNPIGDEPGAIEAQEKQDQKCREKMSIAMKHFRRVSRSSGTSRSMILSSPDSSSKAALILWNGLSAHRARTREHWLTARTARGDGRVHAPDQAGTAREDAEKR